MSDAAELRPLPPPTGLGGVLGQPRATGALRGALAAGRLAHAYAFVGPEGVGKATTARALAAALLCERPPGPGDGCGHCFDCRALQRGDHPDLRVAAPPEGKRALPLAVIQELCQELALRPARGRRRVAIVDQADRCTEEAANALLKTLEEPPGAALLVLIAEDLSPLPSTIRSRCQLLRFGPLPREVIAERLAAAGCPATETAGRAERADGSLGAAWRDDGAGTAAAAELLAPLRDPEDGEAVSSRAQAVVEHCRAEGDGTEGLRQGLTRLLAAAVALERTTLRRELEQAPAGGGAGRAPESRLRALLAARRAVRANATPELVVETLLLHLSRHGVASKAL